MNDSAEASYVNFSTTIDGYDSEDDLLCDWVLENIGECENCGRAERTGCCCTNLEWDMEELQMTEGEVFETYRLSAHDDKCERLERQRKRQRLKRIRFWQKIVLLIRIVSCWRKFAAAPDSKAAQTAAKRFKKMKNA